MNIGIDARLYGLEHAGIGRYIINLVNHLLKIDHQNHYTLFLRQKYYRQLKFPSAVTKIKAEINHYSFKEQFYLHRLIESQNLDLVHFPHFNVPILYRRPYVVTIHDLLWHHFKGLQVTTLPAPIYLIKYLGYRVIVNHALHAAQKILVPSNWVKLQLLQQSCLDSQKIAVTYEGIGEIFTTPVKPLNLKLILPQLNLDIPFVVYTGSAYPHKNIRLLIKAIEIINQSTPLQLVLVSARSVFLKELQQFVSHQKLAHKVFFAGYLSDRQLVSLYQRAKILVHPSLSEGFGLTGLEAMAVGLPVLASRAGSLPEVYGPAAIYFSPSSVNDLVKKISLLLTDYQLYRQLKLKGKDQTQQFSWDTTARQTLEIYHQVHQQLKSRPSLDSL